MHSWQRAGRWAQRPPPGETGETVGNPHREFILYGASPPHTLLCVPLLAPSPFLNLWEPDPQLFILPCRLRGGPPSSALHCRGEKAVLPRDSAGGPARGGRGAGTQGGEPAGQGAAQLTFLVWKSLVREGSRTHKI